MATQIKTGLIANDAITDAKIANVALTGVTASSGDSSTSLATTAFVAGEINSLIDSAPGALNTLNELAAAMGDDANFSTTVTNSIAAKLPLAGGTLTGDLVLKSDGGSDVINVVHSGNTVQLVTIGQSSDNSGNGVIQLKRNNGVLHSQIHSHGNTYFNGGNVGIGFASGTPDAQLHVNSGTTNVAAKFESTDGTTAIQFTDNGGSAEIGNSGADVVLFPNGTEKFRVQNSTGYLIAQSASQVRLVLGSTGNSSNNTSNWIRGTGGDLGLNAASGSIGFEIGGTERMNLHSSGNLTIGASTSNVDVGIGNTGTVGHLGRTGSGALLHLGGDDCQVRLANSIIHHDNSGNTNLYLRNHYTTLGSDNNAKITLESGQLIFATSTNYTERMRINQNGTVMVGTSTNPTYAHKLYASGNAITNGTVFFEDTDVSCGLANVVMKLSFSEDNDATNASFIYMTDGNSVLGTVGVASGTSVSYSSASDERMKKNIVDASPQLDIIKTVKVREFDWKKNDHHELGLIAQEVNTVFPNVVKVGSDDETEHPWSVDYGKLTPYLIKAMQEQQTIIEDLKSRIEILEG